MAQPRESDLEKTYYHGTPDKNDAMAIMQEGIQPPDLTTREQTSLTPREGRVYITPSIKYAQIYALGGNYAGHSPRDSMLEKSIYGYLFVIDGGKLKDIEPDEDSVGKLIERERFDWLNRRARNFMEHEATVDLLKEYGVSSEELEEVGRMRGGMNLPLGVYLEAKDGMVIFQATIGRILMDRVLTDSDKLKILSEDDVHVAHTGPLQPDEAWRVDKRDSEKLRSDGSNFFDVAKRID